MAKQRLKVAGTEAYWIAAWRSVKLGDTVIASEPGRDAVKFQVTVRSGGEGVGPVQIAGEGTQLYSEPQPLQIVGKG